MCGPNAKCLHPGPGAGAVGTELPFLTLALSSAETSAYSMLLLDPAFGTLESVPLLVSYSMRILSLLEGHRSQAPHSQEHAEWGARASRTYSSL